MRRFIITALLAVGIGVGQVALAQQGGYQDINPPVETRNADQVEVLEFFWFGCPHCFAFEPTINAWAETRPDHVSFVREAPPLNPRWLPHSQAYYASKVLQVEAEFFDPFFNEIHLRKRQLNHQDSIAKFAEKLLGIDKDLFKKTMNSFEVDMHIRRAMKLAQGAGVRSVPSVIVNGKYLTSGSLAGSNERVIEVINKLIVQEHTS
jgi:thiol:disulfide interchange protein DsbA